MSTAFVAPSLIPFVPVHTRASVQRRPRFTRITASLSEPFPLPDLFAFPSVAFPSSAAASDYRPELLGSLLWTAGLYFGFSQKRRWGTALQTALTATLSAAPYAEYVAISVHTLPFLAAGFIIDAALRYFNGGNAVWAIASGVTVAMYAGVYELGRISAQGKKVGEEEVVQFGLFREFAQRKLKARGMCHLTDIRQAVREDPSARSLSRLSDATFRKFMRNTFPQARRSRNDFYRGVSIRQQVDKRLDT